MKKDLSKIIVIISIFLLIVLIVVLLSFNNAKEKTPSNNPSNDPSSNPTTEEKLKKDYLVVNDTDLWQYSNNSWQEINNFNIENQNFSIYINKEYLGFYELRYINNWSIFDSDNNYIDYDGNILAFTSNLKINVKKYAISKINENDLNKINSLLKSDIKMEELSTNELVEIDLNNDGINDRLVNVSNVDSENSSIYFSLIYAIINGEEKIIHQKIIKEEDIMNNPIYNIEYIFTFNNEVDNIIIRERYYSFSGETNCLMYEYENNNYHKVID